MSIFPHLENLLPAINGNGNVMNLATPWGQYQGIAIKVNLDRAAHPSQNAPRYLTGDSRGPNEIDSLTRV